MKIVAMILMAIFLLGIIIAGASQFNSATSSLSIKEIDGHEYVILSHEKGAGIVHAASCSHDMHIHQFSR
jgi:hypothetical protein